MAHDALAEFEALFDEDSADAIAESDQATERIISIMNLGMDVIEDIIMNGEPNAQIAALTKIFPLAVKVAERRTDAELNRVVKTCQAMFLEIFPNRVNVEEQFAEIEAEFDIPDFSASVEDEQAPVHQPPVDPST